MLFLFPPFKVSKSRQHAISASSEEKYVSSFLLPFCLLSLIKQLLSLMFIWDTVPYAQSSPCGSEWMRMHPVLLSHTCAI